MPLSYQGIIAEHCAVRESAGLFDVSHMGQLRFRGNGAIAAVDRLVTNNVGGLADGGALYTPICNDHGGVVDDCLVYRLAADDVLVIVNASNVKKDADWFLAHLGPNCEMFDESEQTALVAIQGPRAVEIFARVAPPTIADLPAFNAATVRAADVECLVARTGYTGEDGFEIACSADRATTLWNALREVGGDQLSLAGLGARDTLRLEARLMLYGNDLDDETTPLEAGLGWTVKLKSKGDFIGKQALQAQKKAGLQRKLVCLVMRSRGIARHGHLIQSTDGTTVGRITSGTKSPTLGEAIALGYVDTAQSTPGTRLVVDVRGRAVDAEVVKGPFYQRAS